MAMRLFPAVDPAHRYPRVTSARVLSALFNLTVGLRLLWPDDSLGGSVAYEHAERIFFGDLGLGLGLLGIGALMAVSLYTGAVDKPAAAATLLGLATWVVFAFALAVTNGSQIGTFAYGILAAGTHAYALTHLLSFRDQQRRDQRRHSGEDVPA